MTTTDPTPPTSDPTLDLKAQARRAQAAVLKARRDELRAAAPAPAAATPNSNSPTPADPDPQDPDWRPPRDQVDHPEDNPAWQPMFKDVAPGRSNKQNRQSLAEYVAGGRQDANVLDDSIYRMRLAGMGVPDIARKLGRSVTVEMVEQRLQALVEKRRLMTTEEYRWLMVGRLEALINMMWSWAEEGSIGHATVILQAAERLNKMWELEKETSEVKIQIVSDGQAELLKRVFAMALDRFMSIPGVAEAVSQDVLYKTLGEATAEAADIIDAPETRYIDPQQLTA